MRKTTISKMQLIGIVTAMAVAIFWSVARYSPSWGFSQTEEITKVRLEMTTPPPEKTPTAQKNMRGNLKPTSEVEVKEIIIATKLMSTNGRLPRSVARQYARYIIKAAKRFDLDPFLIAAVIIKESTANFMSASYCAHGLMQVNWNVHKDWLRSVFPAVRELRDIYDPEQNIMAGSLLLSGYLKRNNGDIKKALSNYLGANSGAYQSFVLKHYHQMHSKYKKLV